MCPQEQEADVLMSARGGLMPTCHAMPYHSHLLFGQLSRLGFRPCFGGQLAQCWYILVNVYECSCPYLYSHLSIQLVLIILVLVHHCGRQSSSLLLIQKKIVLTHGACATMYRVPGTDRILGAARLHAV